MKKPTLLALLVMLVILLTWGCNDSKNEDETTAATTAALRFDDNLARENEEIVFSFLLDDQQNKRSTLCIDKSGEYLVFRFGASPSNVIEVTGMRQDTHKAFSYDYYFRGGGKENLGLDLNYLYFADASYQYDLFDEFDAVDESRSIGITIHSLADESSKTYYAADSTIIGSLGAIRDDRFSELITWEE